MLTALSLNIPLPEPPVLEERALLTRRAFLGKAAGLASGCALALMPGLSAAASDEFWGQPRTLKLYRPATDEHVTRTYWREGNWDLEGYVEICKLMRDVRGNEAVQMDRTLLDILFGIQEWLAHETGAQQLVVTSGFRSKSTNSKLEGAAQNSMHLYGRAADIRVPNVSASLLSKMGRYFGAGVGLYEKSNFAHIDTGRARFWRA